MTMKEWLFRRRLTHFDAIAIATLSVIWNNAGFSFDAFLAAVVFVVAILFGIKMEEEVYAETLSKEER